MINVDHATVLVKKFHVFLKNYIDTDDRYGNIVIIMANKQNKTEQRTGISLEECRFSRGLIAKLQKHAKAKGMTSAGFTKELCLLALKNGLHKQIRKL